MFGKYSLFSSLAALVVYVASYNVNVAASSHEKNAMLAAMMPHVIECLNEFDKTFGDVKKLEASPEYNCFANCFYKKSGIIDENGMFDGKKVSEYSRLFIKDEETLGKVDELIKECSKVNDKKFENDENCEKAKIINDCLEPYKHIFE